MMLLQLGGGGGGGGVLIVWGFMHVDPLVYVKLQHTQSDKE